MPHVSCGKGGASRERDACNPRVAHVHRTPGFLALGGQGCGFSINWSRRIQESEGMQASFTIVLGSVGC
jgi:hypothetical protein